MRSRISIAAGLLVLAALGALAAAAPRDVQDFRFESFDAVYELSQLPDGRSQLAVQETIVAIFPDVDQNRGIIRELPASYDGVPLNVQVLSVEDLAGVAVPFEQSRFGGIVELALGTDEFVHGRTGYVIRYTMENVVRAFPGDGVDELYWDVNGVGWRQPMDRVSASLTLDEASSAALTGAASCYRGAEGSTTPCELAEGLAFSAQSLAAGETLTIAIGFEAGTFTQVEPVEELGVDDIPFLNPAPGAGLWSNLGGAIVLLIGLAGTGLAALLRFRSRGARGRGIIIPQYTAPKGMSLLEAAEVAGRTSAGVPAQLVDLAVRGNLRILDYGVTPGSGARYTLQFLHDQGLSGDERRLVSAMFGLGALDAGALITVFELAGFSVQQRSALASSLDGITPQPGALAELGPRSVSVGAAVRAVVAAVRQRLLDTGAIVRRSSLPGVLLAVLMFVLIFVAISLELIGAFLGSVFVQGFGIAFGAVFVLALCMVACVILAYRPPAVGEAGADRRDYLLGIREYLQLAEADRIRMLQSPEGAERLRVAGLDPASPVTVVKLYERLLPFAVLWGIEQRWAAELAVHYGTDTPDWFVGSSGFSAPSFTSSIAGLGLSVRATTSPPSSSSGSSSSSGGSFSSGSSGGGFSGGGGGGGGGGGR